MNTFLVLLLIAAMIATVVALVRGIATFLMQSTEEVHGEKREGPSPSALKSNKMMQQRIMFQAAAILIAALLLLMSGKH
ncbi:MAG: twin transmembrane helix small protein [Pseudomonadota bacterium]|nr:twin transmembrane helix small protein [Pseudomonadota bacterium]